MTRTINAEDYIQQPTSLVTAGSGENLESQKYSGVLGVNRLGTLDTRDRKPDKTARPSYYNAVLDTIAESGQQVSCAKLRKTLSSVRTPTAKIHGTLPAERCPKKKNTNISNKLAESLAEQGKRSWLCLSEYEATPRVITF